MKSDLFEGLKIIDLSTVLAGPSVASFFAELGAEVIKIENPITSGDVTRSWKLETEDRSSNVSAYFSAVNYGKKYIWLNIMDTTDRSSLLEIIKTSDVLITNFKEGDDQKFGLTSREMHDLNPQLIYARITGFEEEKNRVAYDVVLQAETGYMQMNGTEESGPVKMPVAMIDVLAAHQLKEGILCALIQRDRSRLGCVVECSLEKAGLSSLVNQATNYLMASYVPGRMGSLHPNISPYGEIFYCQDGKGIVLAVGSDKQFSKLATILKAEFIQSDTRFTNNQGRVQFRAELSSILSPLFKQKSRDIWMIEFKKHFIPAGAIRSMDEVLSGKVATEMILEENIDGVKTRRLSSVAFDLKSV